MIPRVLFTDKNLQELEFRQRITGTNADGMFETEPVQPGLNDWSARDVLVSQLYLRMSATAMTWCVVATLGGQSVRRSFAPYRTLRNGVAVGGMSLAKARQIAKEYLAMMARGVDPAAAKVVLEREGKTELDRRKLTFKLAYSDFCDAKNAKSKPGTNTDRGKVAKWLAGSPLWSVPVVDIDQSAVRTTLQPLLDACMRGTPLPATWGPKSISKGTLDKLYTYPSGAYMHAARKLKLHIGEGENPFVMWRAGEKWPESVSRETQLETDTSEGRQWLRGLIALQQRAHDPRVLANRADPRGRELKPHVSVLADFFLCLLLWGSRKDETAKLRFSSVNFANGYLIFPGRTTKSGHDGMVPLTPWAIEVLEQRRAANKVWRPDAKDDFVFPARQHGKPLNNPRSVLTTLQEETKSDDNPDGLWITAHVLRHTLATELYQDKFTEEELGKLLAIGASLNHARGRTGSVPSKATSGYIRNKASILRPHFVAREERLRAIAGLPPLTVAAPTSGDEDDLAALVARADEDEGFRRQLLERLFEKRKAG